MKMKFLSVALVVTGIILFSSCQKESSQGVNNPTPKFVNVIATVVENPPSNPTAGRLLWLPNGTFARPVTGFSQFPTAAIGSRFRISFDSTGTSGPRIMNIAVSAFQSIRDTVGGPRDTVGGPRDTVRGIFSGTYSGIFTSRAQGSNVTDSGPTYIVFTGINYLGGAAPSGFPHGGSGIYAIDPASTDTAGIVSFTDHNTWPAGTDPRLILNGYFRYSRSGNNLTIYNQADSAGQSFVRYELHR
jgi:hypothetical protein